MPSRIRSRVVWAWLAVALWTALVWTLSGDEFSAGATSRFIGPLVRWLFPALSETSLDWIQGAVRKGAHVAEYAVLALLGLRALRLSGSATWLRAAALAFALVLVVAIGDETHQFFVEDRTGSARDVGLDGAGALSILAIAGIWRRGRAPARRDA